MRFKIFVHPDSAFLNALSHELINDEDLKKAGVNFEPLVRTRSEPGLLIAIVTVSGTVMGALITGLLGIVQKSGGSTIVIQSRHGSRLEIPASTPLKKVDFYVTKLKEMEAEQIFLK